MTEQEIRSRQPGPELDRLIAETFYNARPCAIEGREGMFVIIGDFGPNDVRPFSGGWYDMRSTEEKAWESIPKYSTNISVAMEVAEKLQAIEELNGKKVRLMVKITILRGRYQVAVIDYLNEVSLSEVITESGPEALTKAALLALRGGNRGEPTQGMPALWLR
ncbi:hypothetical protein AV654_17645 [Paenibacillus elgii]|uniref:Phage ABA sandwich domain-containing protein n=1 Tax=Paenibacillus elgii TaxID=189691 RepID=A0A161S424_9BACL|nr:hypothetical protein [Paenibacillus elgii]KZE79294.1 hypothetical protein AV654_17645 [Paenibacillus elgii]